MSNIDELRSAIDKIDDEILKLLNKRAENVVKIGHIKREKNINVYVPEREQQIIERLITNNKKSFPDDALKSVYREILSASLSLEEPLKVSYFGSLATYTHLAALRHFGSSANFIASESIKTVFDNVETGRSEYGVVPIENSNEGVVNYTLDLFADSDLKISAEIMLEISHNLLSKQTDRTKIKKIYSHPQALAQCRDWLRINMHGVSIIEATSTSKAAELAAADPEAAAIASSLASKIYDLPILDKNIEDSKQNITRFLVISKNFPKRTGKDKTSLMFSIKDKPGSLYDILYPFKKAGLNLTKIESRPSKKKAWDYIFFVDLEGHIEDKKVKKAIETVKGGCLYFKILGSYPQGSIK